MKRLSMSNKRKCLFIAMLALVAGVIITQACFAKTTLNAEDEAMFSQNNILFYEPCGTGNNDSDNNNASICNADLPEETLERLESENIKQKAEQNMERYKYASDQTGVMWQAIAALHYREGGMSQDQSILNGEKLYDHINVDGKRISSDANEDAKNAAEHLIAAGKSVYNVDIVTDQSKDALAKAFLAYNRGNMYTSKCGEDVPYTSSPYVMNYYDDQHMEMTWIHADSYCGDRKINSVEGSKNTQLGALVILSYLCGDDEDAGAAIDGIEDAYDESDNNEGNASDSSSIGGGAKAISDAAAKLAWPKGTPESKYNTKDGSGRSPAYAEAVEELGLKGHGHTETPDCGDFVETVVKYSGYDKKYGKTNSYIQKHPDLWEFIEWDDGDTSKLRAGDIVYGKGGNSGTGQHWWVVTEVDGKLYRAEASLTGVKWGHIGSAVKGTWKKYDHQWIYRAKGGGSSEPACNSCAQGSMNINGSAACLAWPIEATSKDYDQDEGGHPVPLMQEAWKKTGLYDAWKDDPDRWESDFCSGWAAAVVRWSGYDPHFSEANSGAYSYVMKHLDIWDVIPWNGNKEELEGGDVLYSDGHHTWMVIEDEAGELYIAEASLTGNLFGHVLEYDDGNASYPNPYIFRAKNAKNSTAGVSVHGDMSSSSTSGTLNETGRGNGDIGASAIELAWPQGTPDATIQTSASAKFKKYFNSLAQSKNDSGTCYAGGKSCDRFVATSVRYSGVDSNMSYGPVPTTLSYLEKTDSWEEVQMSNPKSLNEYKSGDVLIFYKSGASSPSHTAIYAEDSNGQGHVVQASYCEYFGVVKDTSSITGSYWGSIRVFRNKNNHGGGANTNCSLCDNGSEEGADGEGDIGPLQDGGVTSLEEGKKIINEYKKLWNDNETARKVYHLDGCYACESNGVQIDNCPALPRWFVNRFTTGKKWIGATGYGKDVANNIANFYGLSTSHTPSAYSIFSGPGSGWAGHTGVVLGIDTNRKKAIIGEAGYCSGYDFIDAKEWDLSKLTSGAYTFTDVNSIINHNGLKGSE